MKRIGIWLLVALMALTLLSCGKDEEKKGTVVSPSQREEREEKRKDTPAASVKLPEQEEEQKEEHEETKPSSGGSKTDATATNSSGKAYYIRINTTCCTVNIYEKDENGDYVVPLKAMVCSTGTATPTSGVYQIGSKWEWLRLQGNVYGHYVTQITGNILFHSVPYLRRGDASSLEYWEFDKLGEKASLGCIRLQVSDAIWIYNNAGKIAGVEFYQDEEAGPLGKPSAPKISDNERCRDWDPTDPNPENPWWSVESDVPQEEIPDDLPQESETEIDEADGDAEEPTVEISDENADDLTQENTAEEEEKQSVS